LPGMAEAVLPSNLPMKVTILQIKIRIDVNICITK